MSSLGAILGWKFDHEPGIRTIEGVITEWPATLGSFPAQTDIDTWIAEFVAAAFDDLKTAKQQDFVTESIKRIAAQVPNLDSLDSIKAIAAIWPEIGASARAKLTKAKDIYLYVRDTVPGKLAAVTTQAELDAIDPTAADPFSDGTLWPT